jgi:hypothetical protein
MNKFRLKINPNSFIDFRNFLSSHFLSLPTNGALESLKYARRMKFRAVKLNVDLVAISQAIKAQFVKK